MGYERNADLELTTPKVSADNGYEAASDGAGRRRKGSESLHSNAGPRLAKSKALGAGLQNLLAMHFDVMVFGATTCCR